MNGEVVDVKTGAESSTAQGATGGSPSPTTTTAESSTAGDKEPSSIAEALEKVKLDHPAGESADAGDGGEHQPGDSPSPKDEAGETTEGKDGAKDGTPDKPEAAHESDVPFHNRREWQEAVKIGGDKIKPILRQLLSSETRLNEQLKQMKPRADEAAELRQIVGGEREFEAMRHLVRGYQQADPAVLPILRQMVQQMEQSTGEVITSKDLQEQQATLQRQYDDGMIDRDEYARQAGLLKEVERSRVSAARVRTQAEHERQGAEQRQQAEAQQRQITAINQWEQGLRQRDPDFGQVTDAGDPKHGESVADQVMDAMMLSAVRNPKVTTEELIAAGQRAYDRARRNIAGPGARQQRVITSQHSSLTGTPRPRNMREAMDRVKLE